MTGFEKSLTVLPLTCSTSPTRTFSASVAKLSASIGLVIRGDVSVMFDEFRLRLKFSSRDVGLSCLRKARFEMEFPAYSRVNSLDMIDLVPSAVGVLTISLALSEYFSPFPRSLIPIL